MCVDIAAPHVHNTIRKGTPLVSSRRADEIPNSGPADDDRVRPGDPEIREALLARLREAHTGDEGVALLEEVGLCRGAVFVDVTLVNGSLHGYEIKSDRDSLRRLARQVAVYSAVLDRATLVVGERHADEAIELIPGWWEVLLAHGTPTGVAIKELRPGAVNEHRQRRALVELLWLDEAHALLAARNALRGFRRKPRPVVWERVCEVYAIDEIAAEVRERLKARPARLVARSRR